MSGPLAGRALAARDVLRATLAAAIMAAASVIVAGTSTVGGPIPGPLPIFPPDNWWNTDISNAPIDPQSAAYISFIGSSRSLHPDFGGDVTPGGQDIYGFPYAVVDSSVAKRAVQFVYADESDGVDPRRA